MNQRKRKLYRYVAAFLAVNILAEVVSPTMAFALTGGPSQPEVESFEPIGTNQMVDLFTGDFSYNIPLMNVPGPNGGYPLNLAYHAGVGMEQEASWCGLGWNINPGVISRQMRGLPDDFKGDKVRKTLHSKPNFTFAAKYIKTGIELAGYDILNNEIKQSTGLIHQVGISYNNYKGIGLSYNYTPAHEKAKRTRMNQNKSFVQFFVSAGFDTQSGFDIEPSLSYAKNLGDKGYRLYTANLGIGSRQGLYNFGVNTGMTKKGELFIKPHRPGSDDSYSAKVSTYSSGRTVGATFHNSSYVPGNSMPMAGFDADFRYNFGVEVPVTTLATGIEGSVSTQWVRDAVIDYEAYGYNNLESCPTASTDEDDYSANEHSIMDFNREKEFPVTKTSPTLPLPVLTNDVYAIKGQGIGGVFRPYRSDIGVLHDPNVASYFGGAQLGIDAAGLFTAKAGINANLSYTNNFSGNWKRRWDDLEEFKFKAGDESFYFKSAGELTAEESDLNFNSYYNYTAPQKFKLTLLQTDDNISFEPRVYNMDQNTSSAILTSGTNYRSRREKRAQGISYKTRGMITNHALYTGGSSYANVPKNVVPLSHINPTLTNWSTYQGYLTNYNYSSGTGTEDKKSDHIAEITVVNPDGNRYIYGIPEYNIYQKEAYFSCDNAVSSGSYLTDKTVTYDSDDDGYDTNKDGNDHFYSSTELPAYAHSYLLTAVYSPDYVDITGNGPSEDDLGYYTKFNYVQITESDPYEWRTPYIDANLVRGGQSNEKDDKASYVYGKKEVWYLHSVETKTHVAMFNLNSESSPRKDGLPVNGEHNLTGGTTQGSLNLKYLEGIDLYSKSDLTKAIKSVHFEYDYSLCKKLVNNSTYSGSQLGKLTLKKVWFSYLGNQKGRLSPYMFDYSAMNPDYSLNDMDRWGYYKPNSSCASVLTPTVTCSNEDYLYVNQDDRTNVDQYMSAWNLSKITLPSGGEINVEYESDDYAYVQNKEATQMFEIVGTGEIGDPNYSSHSDLLEHNGNIHDLIWFPLKKDYESGSYITNAASYIPDPDPVTHKRYIYFKAYTELKVKPDHTEKAKDYVDGYFEIVGYGTDGNYGYVQVAAVPVAKTTGNTHPIRKAAWQYMKLERPGLFYPELSESGLGWQFVNSFIGIVKNLEQLILGYYRTCHVNGYAKRLELGGIKPSFIRLRNPDSHKMGGGHRVKKISIDDQWNTIINGPSTRDAGANDEVFGQEYQYILPDGKSSGVAEYEPVMGEEENPFRHPSSIYNSTNGILSFKSDDLYVDEPVGESYYPGANVGYSRVIVKSLKREASSVELNPTTASGIAVNEFYTAKDYPVLIDRTEVTEKAFCPFFPIPIPFVGTIDLDMRGYSQGYSISLNDMHGKPKSTATYAHNENVNSSSASPVTKSEYIYQTTGGYSPEKVNTLNNVVTVLDGDGISRDALMGQKMESFIDLNQHSSYSIGAGVQANVDYTAPVVLAPSSWPKLSWDKSQFRSVVYNKVIYKTGILTEIRNTQNASTAISKNLMFDKETGQPLLTSVTNDFDDPVFTYQYAAHWAYPNMGGYYNNVGYSVTGSSNFTVVGGVVTFGVGIASAIDFFHVGDQVAVLNSTYNDYWVSAVGTSSITLIDRSGTAYAGGAPNAIVITKPVFSNQQSITNGKIVTLKDNPVTGTASNSTLFAALNKELDANNTFGGGDNFFHYDNCDGTDISVHFSFNITVPYSITFSTSTSPCATSSPHPNIQLPFLMDMTNFYDYRFYRTGPSGSNQVKIVNITNGTEYDLTLDNAVDCFTSNCYQSVLHADATHYKDDWPYNYVDAGIASGSSTHTALTATNDYATGRKGIWRNFNNWVYQVDRQQSSTHTNIQVDGLYDKFLPHKWTGTDQATIQAANPDWTFVSEVTRYSPFGFETENRDALNNYSSALYGYNSALVTAVAKNSSYQEMAFDGFEDHGSSYVTAPTHGHLPIAGTPTLTAGVAHTGSKSLAVGSSGISSTIQTGNLLSGVATTSADDLTVIMSTPTITSKYLISAWFKQGTYSALNTPYISITHAQGTPVMTLGPVIDGWQKVDYVFEVPQTNANAMVMTFGFQNSATGYVDDIRVQPFKSAITTYVYDPVTLWLTAELDNRNFATYYNYDSEGSLVQVKKETEKGIMTLKTSRNNVRRNPNP